MTKEERQNLDQNYTLWRPVDLWRWPLFRLLIWLLSMGGAIWFLSHQWGIFLPVVLAFLIAYLSQPIVDKCSEKGISRPLISGILVVSVLLFFTAVLVWAGPLLSDQLKQLSRELPGYVETLQNQIGLDLSEIIKDISNNQKLQSVDDKVLGSADRLWSFLKTFFSKASYLLYVFVMIPIFWFIFMVHYHRITKFFFQFVPRSKRISFKNIMHKIDIAVSGFFRGRFIIALIIGVFYSVGWYLAGVPFWFILGMATGLLCIIPYASALGWPVAIVLKYYQTVQTGSETVTFMETFFWPSFVYGSGQFIEGWILTPWIQGEKLDLHEGTVLVVVFIGGAMGGILGMLLAIPVAASIKIILWDVVLPRLKKWADQH